MKLLLVLLVVLFGVWLWRSRRLSEGAPPQRTARSTRYAGCIYLQ
jgi:uncharacterized iron-regulated membrane protein